MDLLTFSLGLIVGLFAYHTLSLIRFAKKLKYVEDFTYREIIDHQKSITAHSTLLSKLDADLDRLEIKVEKLSVD